MNSFEPKELLQTIKGRNAMNWDYTDSDLGEDEWLEHFRRSGPLCLDFICLETLKRSIPLKVMCSLVIWSGVQNPKSSRNHFLLKFSQKPVSTSLNSILSIFLNSELEIHQRHALLENWISEFAVHENIVSSLSAEVHNT